MEEDSVQQDSSSISSELTISEAQQETMEYLPTTTTEKVEVPKCGGVMKMADGKLWPFVGTDPDAKCNI